MPFLGTTGGGSVKQYGGQANLGYFIKNSLRFRSGASGNLSRTPGSSSNQRTWTWSAWIKRGTLTTDQMFFSAVNTYMRWGNGTEDTLWLNFRGAGGTNYFFQTTQVFRDPAAWYHIVLAVDTTQATGSNRVKLYSNGVQITAFTTYAEYPPQNHDTAVNSTTAHTLGSYSTGAIYFDGYMAEINLIDGLQLTPSSFGKTDAGTNQWIPKKFAGTYGTNGFYLKFADTSAATAAAIGKDSSPNGNNWTPNNISVTAGVTYDAMIDSPTLSGAASNYCVLNTLEKTGGSVVDGSLNFTNGSATNHMVGSTFVPTGLCYAEFQPTGWGNGNNNIGLRTNLGASNSLISASGGVAYELRNGAVIFNGTTQATYTAATGTSNVAMLAYDPSSGKLWFGLDGTWFNSGNPAAGTGQVYTITTPTDAWRIFVQSWDATNAMSANFGQRPFAYTPPTGFKSLNTYNLP